MQVEAVETESIIPSPLDILWWWLQQETYGIPNWAIVAGVLGAIAIGVAVGEEERRRREMLLLLAR